MKSKQILLLLLLILIGFITVNFSKDKRDLSGDYSSTKIRQIQIGMNLEDVQEILGTPY
jgi:outer membrane protein assembly factor BamE (lipoprotein component of BamABCDE complex)